MRPTDIREPMAELRRSFVAADKSTRWRLNADQGAGANAVSRDEMTFVSNNFLSELVWSPGKGLCIKCTERGLSKNNSLVWDSDSGNMVILPSPSIERKENNRAVNEEKVCSMPLPSCPENEVHVTETSSDSSSDSAGIIQPCGAKCFKDPLKGDCNTDELLEKEVDIYSTGDTQNHGNVNEKRTFSSDSLQDYGSMEDRENGVTAISLPSRPEEPRIQNVSVGPETENHPVHVVGAYVQASLSASTASVEPKLGQYNNIQKDFERTDGCKASMEEKQKQKAENDIKLSKTEDKLFSGSAFAGLSLIVASVIPDNEVSQTPSNIAVSTESLNERGSSLKRRKFDENEYHDTEVDQGILKVNDGIHESFKSNDIGQLFTDGRKVGKFEHELIVGKKKIKKHKNETPGSASFLGQDGSFVRWISNIAKGFSNLGSFNAPYLAIPVETAYHRHESGDPHFISNDRIRETVGRSKQFQNIFQALHCSPCGVFQKRMKSNHNHQTETDVSRELGVVDEMPWDIVARACFISNEKDKFNKFINLGMSNMPIVSSSGITMDDVKNRNTCNIASNTKDGVIDSDLSSKNDERLPEKEAIAHGFIGPTKFSDPLVNSGPLENLWIARYSSKVSTMISNSEHGQQDKIKTIEASEDKNALNDGKKADDICESSDKDQMNAASMQHCPLSFNSSCGSIKTRAKSDWKLNPKFNPILPPQKLNKSEAMASLFARRLDALKNIDISNVEENASPETKRCFYCGKKGHLLSECSEINENELKFLLKDVNSYAMFKETSCLCIRCFQFSHWAIACPYLSSQKQTHLDGGDYLPSGADDLRKQSNSHGEKNPLLDNFAVGSFKEMTAPDGTISDCAIKKGLLGEKGSRVMSQKGVSSLQHEIDASVIEVNKLKDSLVKPCVNKQNPSMLREAFDIIKRLRLSRSDILKWAKSPCFNFCLEGFFLRLRLGKWGAGLGGASYHVACISGAHQESSGGKHKISILVDIRGLKCAVDCRYISNHDFSEDELKAWWCAHLRDSGKVPRMEELNMKLVEKTKRGFCNSML